MDPSRILRFSRKVSKTIIITLMLRYMQVYKYLRIMSKFDLHYKNVGTADFIHKLNQKIVNINVKKLAMEFEATESTIKLIIEVLLKPLAYDLREENRQEPLFRKGITSLSDLTTNMKLTGRYILFSLM